MRNTWVFDQILQYSHPQKFRSTMKHPFLAFLTLFAAGHIFAQIPVATADQIVSIALETNYDIRLTQTDVAIAQLNNTRANAGILPTVNLVANENFTLSAFNQQLANGTEFNTLGAPFNSANIGVQLNWPLLDGRRMYIVKRRLEALESLGQLNLRIAVQTTTVNVLQAYYNIVRGRLQERALTEIIALNEERLRIAEARLAAGFAAQTDALQARIDLNQRRADFLNQQTATIAAKRTLNRLLVRASDVAFEVDENLVNTYQPDRNTLLQKILAQNPTLVALQKTAEVSALLVEESRTLNKVRINGVGQLSAQRADNGAGFTTSNTQAGLSLGANLVVPLYTGGNLRRQVEVSRLAAQQAVLRVDIQRITVETELDNQIALFQTQQQVLTLEEENVLIARENLNVSTERFRLGQANGLEIQIAQNTLEQALSRRNLVLYNLKVAELQLRFLAGDL